MAAAVGLLAVETTRITDNSVLLEWETDHQVRTTKSGTWVRATPTGGTHRLATAPGEGRNGGEAGKIVGTTSENNARGCFIRNLPDMTDPGTYTYSVWYRTGDQGEGGLARITIDCYVGDERTYTGLVNRALTPSETWLEATGEFTLPADVRLSRVLLYQRGEGTVWYDSVSVSKQDTGAVFLGGGPLGGQAGWRVFYRKAGEADWQRSGGVIMERFHNVIFLEPDTAYEFRVDRVDANGDVVSNGKILAARTLPAGAPRVWQGLELGRRLDPETPPAIYPCIESVDGRLFFSESRGGVLWLSELDDTFRAQWTKQWVKPFLVDGRPCYQGQTQTARLGDRLFISWKRAYDGDAPNARQCVASYALSTGEIGEPYVIEPDTAGESTWNGGITAWNGRLWVSYCRWRKENDKTRTTVTVRQLDYDARTLGPAFELPDQPTDTPYTPFLSVFNDELVVCFTDLASAPDRQPLWLVRFDGTRFHDLMTVSPTGYNQYAKGAQYGDKLLLVWKYGAPYPARIYGRYMFHDIGLALVDPIQKTVERTSLVDDIKYNSSPDITAHNGRFVVVFNTFEHLYGDPADRGQLYGSFLTTITPPDAK
jgi:hypothetical protein